MNERLAYIASRTAKYGTNQRRVSPSDVNGR